MPRSKKFSSASSSSTDGKGKKEKQPKSSSNDRSAHPAGPTSVLLSAASNSAGNSEIDSEPDDNSDASSASNSQGFSNGSDLDDNSSNGDKEFGAPDEVINLDGADSASHGGGNSFGASSSNSSRRSKHNETYLAEIEQMQKALAVLANATSTTTKNLTALVAENGAKSTTVSRHSSASSFDNLVKLAGVRSRAAIAPHPDAFASVFMFLDETNDRLLDRTKQVRKSRVSPACGLRQYVNANTAPFICPNKERYENASISYANEAEYLARYFKSLQHLDDLLFNFRAAEAHSENRLIKSNPAFTSSVLEISHVVVQQLLILLCAREHELSVLSKAKSNDARDAIRQAFKDRFSGHLSSYSVAETNLIVKQISQNRKTNDAVAAAKKPNNKSRSGNDAGKSNNIKTFRPNPKTTDKSAKKGGKSE